MAISLSKIGQAVFLFAFTGLGLHAQAPTLGLQVLGSVPTGSMRSQYTSSTGLGIGAFADWEVNFGADLRLAYDGVFYPGSTDGELLPGMPPTVVTVSNDRKYRSDTLSLQYLYYPDARNEGFYFMVGLGAVKQTEKIATTAVLSDSTTLSLNPVQDTGTRLACMAGLGYEFAKNWGAFGRYTFSTVDSHTIGAAQAGLTCRF